MYENPNNDQKVGSIESSPQLNIILDKYQEKFMELQKEYSENYDHLIIKTNNDEYNYFT